MWSWVRELIGDGGTEPAGSPAVRAALAAAPPVFAGLTVEAMRGEPVFERGLLPELLDVTRQEGHVWELSLADEVLLIVDTDAGDDDLVTRALTGQPGVLDVYHADPGSYEITLARPERPAAVLARCVRALIDAHRGLAARLGVPLPD